MLKHALVSAALLLSPLSAFAGAPVPVMLAPMEHQQAVLVVVGKDGTSTSYTPADLEGLPTYSMTTSTPWREKPAQFEGILLSDLLKKHSLDSVPSILVTAENDYATTIHRDLLDSVTIMLATRVDGKPHSRRFRGPIQFVIDSQAFADSPLTAESNLVWMAARIEPGN